MAHQKHAKLAKPDRGNYGRLEISLIGAPCGEIKRLSGALLDRLNQYNIAYLDADHQAPESDGFNALDHGASAQLTNKISHYALDLKNSEGHYFNEADLVLINGNHFEAAAQIAWVHPKKSLEHKLDKLTDVRAVLLEHGQTIPEYLEKHLAKQNFEVINSLEVEKISNLIVDEIKNKAPKLNGLVLVGGKSTRMQQDKSKIVIRNDKPQFEYLTELLKNYCDEVFVSARDEEQGNEFNIKAIADKFVGLGPYGGILSAFQADPNSAWLVVAVDLPFLDDKAIKTLVKKRQVSKVATCYIDRNYEFPEPLITIWEPKAYPILLNFLAKGYSCPRKALINSDVNIISERDESILTNVNSPDELLEAKSRLS